MQERLGTADEAVMDGPPLIEEQRGPIAVLTLDRPLFRNTLSEAMLSALQAAVDRVSADRAVRAVIIAANGPAFCAGHDMKEMTGRRSDADGGRAYFADLMDRCAAMMQSIVRSPKP